MAKTLEQLDQELSDLGGKLKAIIDSAKKDSGGKLSADQKTEYDRLDAEYDAALSAKESLAKELAETAAREAKLADRAKRSEDASSNLNRLQPRLTLPDSSPDVRIEAVKPEGFKSLGEQLQAIAHAGMHGDHPQSRDQRLQWELLAPATGAAVASTPSDGGYLIQKDFLGELITRMNDIGQLKSRVRTIPIGPNSDGLKTWAVDETSRATGSRWGGVQVYWGAENDAATAKKPKLRQLELELKDLIGLAYVSNRLLQDASAIEAIFSQAFSEEMNFACEDALVNGLGGGQPLGILASGATVSVAKESGQAAATIVFENIQKMWARLWSRSRPNAVWIYNQDCEPQLNQMSIPVGTGGVPVYLPPGGLSQSPYGTLMGRPLIPVEYCATLGTVGDIILADFSQMLAIEKGSMAADSSIHVRFTTNENTFRFIYRYDAQPVWNSALTPFKGSNTQSPFITLATRA